MIMSMSKSSRNTGPNQPWAILCLGLLVGLSLFAATPIPITPNQNGTVGVAASTSQLLFTQPFCQTTGITRGVYSVNTTTGVPSLYSAIPETAGECTENYIALATSLNTPAGFVAGTAYVTRNSIIYSIPPGGGAATPVTITGTALAATEGHSGIGFDVVGTFCFNLLFSSSQGVWKIT